MKYKVRELEVEAYQALKDGSIDPPEWIVTAYNNHVLYFSEDDDRLFLKGLDSDTEVHDTDYIIQGAKSGLYGSESVNIFVMTADEFHDNYEPIYVKKCGIERTCVPCYSGQGQCEALQPFLDDLKEISYKHGMVVTVTKESGDNVAVVPMEYNDRDAGVSYQEVITGSGFITF